MFKYLCDTIIKIKTFVDISRDNTNSPETKATTKNGAAVATSGDHSPVFIGGNHSHGKKDSEDSIKQSEAENAQVVKFLNTLKAVAHELPFNFRHRGNAGNPFITHALKKLAYDEPLVHDDPQLYLLAIRCLNTAETLSSATPYHPVLKPADGQYLMNELANYICTNYGIKGSEQK